MRSAKLCETLVVIASLYYTAVAFPLFPTALPTESAEATAENIPTTTTPASTTLAPLPTSEPTSLPSALAGGMPGTLGGFLQVHSQGNKGESSASIPDSTHNSTRGDQPQSLQNFLKIHTPESSANILLAFHLQLYTNITLRRHAEIELQNFTQLKPGQFAMGKPSFDPFGGAFIAPVKGIYHFTAQVHLFDNLLQEAIENSYINVSICIDRDCKNIAALQSIAGITSERFSALVTGELQVEKDQVVSAFVKNNSDRRLVVDEATSFMGYFISDSL